LHVQLPTSAETRLQVLKSPDAAKCTITEHWGQRDQPAVIEFVLNKFKGYKLCIVGHSLGGTIMGRNSAHLSGHIMPLLPEGLRSQIFRAVFVAVNSPHWQNVPAHFVDKFREIWSNAMDMTQKKGYLPRSALAFAITLPAGPALEWGRAMLGVDKRYLAGIPEVASFYTSWIPKNEIISLVFSDDMVLLSQKDPVPIDAWCDVLTQARITRVLISPKKYGWMEVGHVGMFKEYQDGLWEMIHDIIMDGKIPSKGVTRRWNQDKARL
jgi:hypothetical protein